MTGTAFPLSPFCLPAPPPSPPPTSLCAFWGWFQALPQGPGLPHHAGETDGIQVGRGWPGTLPGGGSFPGRGRQVLARGRRQGHRLQRWRVGPETHSPRQGPRLHPRPRPWVALGAIVGKQEVGGRGVTPQQARGVSGGLRPVGTLALALATCGGTGLWMRTTEGRGTQGQPQAVAVLLPGGVAWESSQEADPRAGLGERGQRPGTLRVRPGGKGHWAGPWPRVQCGAASLGASDGPRPSRSWAWGGAEGWGLGPAAPQSGHGNLTNSHRARPPMA